MLQIINCPLCNQIIYNCLSKTYKKNGISHVCFNISSFWRPKKVSNKYYHNVIYYKIRDGEYLYSFSYTFRNLKKPFVMDHIKLERIYLGNLEFRDYVRNFFLF